MKRPAPTPYENAVLQQRTEWIRRKLKEKEKECHFANGFRAGLECALLALDGHDILGNSIDPQKSK